MLSDGQERYVVRHSLFANGELEALEAELAGDSEVDLVYKNGSERIYRYG